ncbi:GNAT family N-acetyltransferase [Saccharothrix australiensis]|uniref:Acetyltransferase (GNAT) family protein n=1 Tax=Saccharothrix australiensis TaxID=2072 RepID=A0A495W949_9PSEU|nr:GNAT family N-acetyltransferase [Saccharothrix australiensis]RKT57265.1 acetyltransferase (GNAT) family protein [Saccharothrix australiensis]
MTAVAELLSTDVLAGAEELADVLADAVEGGASVGFLSPLPRPHAVSWWRAQAAAVANGVLAVWVARAEGRIVGTVQVRFTSTLNGTHRAEVAKLLVLRRARGAGLGRRLLAAAERGAAGRGATLLTLDTRTGSPAEALYRSAGWTEVGVIPDYATDPRGALHPTTVFFKRLGTPEERRAG